MRLYSFWHYSCAFRDIYGLPRRQRGDENWLSSQRLALPMFEKPRKIGVSVETPTQIIDRKIAIAPMMDWTD